MFHYRCVVTTCSVMPTRSAMGWPCSLAVWRSGESLHSSAHKSMSYLNLVALLMGLTPDDLFTFMLYMYCITENYCWNNRDLFICIQQILTCYSVFAGDSTKTWMQKVLKRNLTLSCWSEFLRSVVSVLKHFFWFVFLEMALKMSKAKFQVVEICVNVTKQCSLLCESDA